MIDILQYFSTLISLLFLFYLKNSIKINSNRSLIAALTLTALFSFSCRKLDTIKKTDILSLPSVTARNDTTTFTDSGKVQLVISFPLMETYENAEIPYSEFRYGINVIFYDGHTESVGRATSKYAKYISKKSLWELKDSVVVINETKDKLETDQLFWDQEKEIIYTDRYVKITNEDQTVIGSGFESDVRLTRRRIRNVTATIYLHDE
jgi:LPS export ABC transporter protein LptC